MIFVIRPEPGLQATLQRTRDRGLPAVGLPLFEVFPRRWSVDGADAYDALLIGSANAIHKGGPGLQSLVDLPVHAVGEATAEAARGAGFTVARTGEGGLQDLLDSAPGPQRYLRIAGADHVSLNVPEGSTMDTVIAYEVRALPVTGSAQVGLRAGDPLVLLHSAAAARHFAGEIARLALDRSAIRLASIGPRVAAAAGPGWASSRSASRPDDGALLDLAQDMCH